MPALAVAAFLTFGTAHPVLAHALFVRSDPAPSAILPLPVSSIHIWFSEDLSPASRIVVWDRVRRDVAGRTSIAPGNPRELVASMSGLRSGSYLVLWTSVSADDGHILHGFFVFSVKREGAVPSLTGLSLGSGGQTFPTDQTLAALLAHWFELLCAVMWAGTAAFAAAILPFITPRLRGESVDRERRYRNRLLLVSLLVLLLSSALILLLQAYQLANNSWSGVLRRSAWSDVFAVQYGRLWIGRQVLVVLSILVLLLPVQGLSTRARAVALTGIAAIYLYLLAASGHAASAAIGTVHGSQVVSLSVLFDWTHLIADALWFGGQVYIVLVLIPALQLRTAHEQFQPFLDALSRFSPFAYAGIVLYSVSGLFAARVHIPSWYALFNSVYGRGLIIKVALIGLMMLTSAFTVFVLRPRIRSLLATAHPTHRQHALRDGLLFWLRVNPVVGTGVLLATSVMFYYPVPYGLGPSPPPAYHASSSGLRATVRISPGRAGADTITIALRDSRGEPVTRARVTVLTTMLSMVMGQGVIVMRLDHHGAFRGTGEFGMGGPWRLAVLVDTPRGNLIRLTVVASIAS